MITTKIKVFYFSVDGEGFEFFKEIEGYCYNTIGGILKPSIFEATISRAPIFDGLTLEITASLNCENNIKELTDAGRGTEYIKSAIISSAEKLGWQVSREPQEKI